MSEKDRARPTAAASRRPDHRPGASRDGDRRCADVSGRTAFWQGRVGCRPTPMSVRTYVLKSSGIARTGPSDLLGVHVFFDIKPFQYVLALRQLPRSRDRRIRPCPPSSRHRSSRSTISRFVERAPAGPEWVTWQALALLPICPLYPVHNLALVEHFRE